MSPKLRTRRRFLTEATTAAGGVASLHGLDFFSTLPLVSAQEANLKRNPVAFDESIEPLVRLIEETPRNKLLERVAERIRGGTSYREVLASLFLAGVRNVQPRPSVGFKFHCVLVVNSCHLASLSGPTSDRWLPLFWGLDYFKSSQADEAQRSGWRMPSVDEAHVPSALQAEQQFIEAMDRWDPAKADVATVALVRSAGATRIFNLFARYAARDYRSIGHKAIYLANAWRTLQVIGWEFAEPVLRSLSYALLNHNGEPNPADSDLAADRPWRDNERRLESIPAGWLDGKLDDKVPMALIESFRQQTPADAAGVATEALAAGVAPQSIWDGVFVGAGELLMRQPGIIGLHGLTTANAVHYLWKHVADDRLRQRLLLQACSFNPMFRESAKGRGELRDVAIDTLEPSDVPSSSEAAVTEILTDISGNRDRAAAKVKSYLQAGGDGKQLIDAARRTLFRKGRDAHDYKFTSAVLEDFEHVSPAWKSSFLATAVFNLKGSNHADSGLVNRTREALS